MKNKKQIHRKFTEEEKISIIEDYKTGNFNFTELGTKYGRTNTTVRKMLIRSGVEIPVLCKHTTKEEQENIVNHFLNEDIGCIELAKIYNISHSLVRIKLYSNFYYYDHLSKAIPTSKPFLHNQLHQNIVRLVYKTVTV